MIPVAYEMVRLKMNFSTCQIVAEVVFFLASMAEIAFPRPNGKQKTFCGVTPAVWTVSLRLLAAIAFAMDGKRIVGPFVFFPDTILQCRGGY